MRGRSPANLLLIAGMAMSLPCLAEPLRAQEASVRGSATVETPWLRPRPPEPVSGTDATGGSTSMGTGSGVRVDRPRARPLTTRPNVAIVAPR